MPATLTPLRAPFGRPLPVDADVLPLRTVHHTVTAAATTVKPAANGIVVVAEAEASSSLWSALVPLRALAVTAKAETVPDRIAIAVEWPQERRLAQVPTRPLVLWVKAAVAEASQRDSRPRLYIPPHLIPAHVSTIGVRVHLHEPIDLDFVVVQPVGDSSSAGDSEHLELNDLTPLYRDAEAVFFRQRNVIETAAGRMRILICEPVQQGLITESTRVIITAPSSAGSGSGKGQNGREYEYEYDFPDSESAAPTHRSLVDDFDPDAFLASSLALSLAHIDEDDRRVGSETDDLAASLSSTSGSLTPRPGHYRTPSPRTPSSPVAAPDDVLNAHDDDGGTRFTVACAAGPASSSHVSGDPVISDAPLTDDVCWAGVGGLGRAGVFEGDWVTIKVADSAGPGRTRIARVVAWERLDEEELAPNTLLVPPSLYRALFPLPLARADVLVHPTPFGARRPTLPTAKSMTLARVATTEGVDKRYERSWLRGLRKYFDVPESEDSIPRLVRRGDLVSIPVWQSRPLDTNADNPTEADADDDADDDDDSDEEFGFDSSPFSFRPEPIGVVYFIVTALSFEPLVPPEDDFRSSAASKARAGELGCWVDAGSSGATRLITSGVERVRVADRQADKLWHGLVPPPLPFSTLATGKFRDLVRSSLSPLALKLGLPLSILIKGARGSGKLSLIRSVADELGLNVVLVPCFEISGDKPTVTEGTLRARLETARTCTPSILVLTHLEAFVHSPTGQAPPSDRPLAITNVIVDVLAAARAAGTDTGFPIVLVATTSAADSIPRDLGACFKHELEIQAPSLSERKAILESVLSDADVAPDVDVAAVAAQAAALQAGDLENLVYLARDGALDRASEGAATVVDAIYAGVAVTSADMTAALGYARSAYADSIGAPKIPNVSWDDVGGLAAVKSDILDTVQLPLEHPELFADGMKKRSGILLYGPPGTGKTLLAKAVATSCALNFLSVKGPELLNMYIGESEANVRRVFERARDASPCIIFMDELDSVAPKRGNQGDSGGVMDRIVSQLLAELDGMGSKRGQVFVMAATNRPDLLDPALLRPGRFDKMLYLGVPDTHEAQRDVLTALTRRFHLDPSISLDDVAARLPLTYTGADLYALCSDAMLRAMSRVAEAVDVRVAELESITGPKRDYPYPLTVQYYLASMAEPEELAVLVTQPDFLYALDRLVPSVSADEMAHYRRVQQEFQGYAIGSNQKKSKKK